MVVVHGQSGSGKTTLTAALAAAGLAYVTDETVCLDPGTLEIEPFRKPLTIKTGSQRVLKHLEPGQDRIDPSSGSWHVDPDALLSFGASELPDRPLHPAVIVFPDFEPDTDGVDVQPVSRARAAFVLGEQSSALWAVEPRPLGALWRLVHRAPAYRVSYASAFDAAPIVVRELLVPGDANPPPLPGPDELSAPSTPASTPLRGLPAPKQGVDWLLLDGEAVLFDGNHLHHLDAPGAAVWELVDGTRDQAQVAAELAERFGADPDTVLLDVEDLVRVLRLQGLLT